MISHSNKQLFKYIGGGIIVVGAFTIMAPGMLSYVFGLWRLISLILTILSVAFLIIFIYNRLKPRREDPPEMYRPQDDTEI